MDEDWRLALISALEAPDLGALRRIPKTDLHCHGLLSAPLATYAQLAGELPPPPAVFGGWPPFADYIGTNLIPILLRGPDTVRTIIRGAFDHLVADGVVYAEMSFDLLLPGFIGLQMGEFADVLAEEKARVVDRITIAPELGIDRTLPADDIAPLLHAAIATGAFRSIDLYADETVGNLDDFVPLYRFAEERGLKLKAHAGELCGASQVRESIEKLHLHAVQHGVRAIESPALTDLLAEQGTRLHICPTSNCSLGVCNSLAHHPARQLFERGVTLTVNSDDFTLFGAGVSEELLNLQIMGFAPAQIVQIVANGLAEAPAAFAR